MRQRSGEIHAIAAAERNWSLFGNHALAEGCQCDRELNCRAGLRAARESQLLILHGDDSAVHVAQGVNGGLANNRVFAARDVTSGKAVRERARREALVVMMAASRDRNTADRRARAAAFGQMVQAAACVLGLADFLGSGFSGRMGVNVRRPTHARQWQARAKGQYETKNASPEHRSVFTPGIYVVRCKHTANGW